MPTEELLCKPGQWYEVCGVFVCAVERTMHGVRLKVSDAEPAANIKRRKRASPAPTSPIELPPADDSAA